MIPVVLSGGSGTRLWPVSRQQLPKQFCEIFDKPLQSLTLERCAQIGKPWVVTGQVLKTLTELNLKQIGVGVHKVIYEPMSKNTAPAIATLCHLMDLMDLEQEVVGVFPSDQLMTKEKSFFESVWFAETIAQSGKIVTLGISPNYPETGYGYIQTQAKSIFEQKGQKAFSVLKFHEKPDLKKAQEFLRLGSFYWNAGIFVFQVRVMIEHFKKHQPEIWNCITKLKLDLSNFSDVYQEVENISIDYAIMEKLNSDELACIPCDLGWSDVGSWDAVASISQNLGLGLKHVTEHPIEVGSTHNYVYGLKDKNYSFVGVHDLILVDTDDALMVVRKGQSQNVKQVVEKLNEQKSKLTKEHVYEDRPWGRFEILKDESHFKSKVIRVNAQSQISYQSHARREEHWIITRGQGEVILNDQVIPVKIGTHVHIPLGAKHRIRNPNKETLEFVEVQLGDYFGEDDIVRYQDDYQRT